MGGTTINNTQSTTGQAGTSGTSGASRAWAPPAGGTLANDRSQVASDQYAIEQNLMAKNTPSSDLSSLQAQYDSDLKQYHTDLQKDAQGLTSGQRGGSFNASQAGEGSFDSDELEAIEGKSQKFDYHNLTFTDSGTGAGNVGGTTDGGGFPGGKGDPEFFGATSLQKGYVSPPDISASSDISQVYNNLTPSQAAYLGWSLQATQSGKQVTVPSQDSKSWNLLAEYAQANNHLLGTGNPDVSTGSVDEQVESSMTTNKPTDVGQVVLGAVTGLFTLGLPADVRAIIPGQAGDVLSALAGVVGGSIVGVGALGGDLAGSALASTTMGASSSVTTLITAVNSIRNVVSAGHLSDAGSALLSEVKQSGSSLAVGSTTNSFSLTADFSNVGQA